MAFRSSGLLREGCVYGVYLLAPKSFEALQRDGLSFLGNDTHPPKENPRNPYGEWGITPTSHEPMALRADNGCDDGRSSPLPVELRRGDARRAMKHPGNFYAVTSNREGLIVIDVRRGLAFVLYYG